MFGTIRPSVSRLGKENYRCYRRYYCGLCFALGERFGKRSRVLLNYDLTNEYLLAAGAVAPQTCETHEARCPCSWHCKRVTYTDQPALSEYFANLNYMLVYEKLKDDELDDGSRRAARIRKKMEPAMPAVLERLSVEQHLFAGYVEDLHEIEQKNELLPVFSVAERFGALMQIMVAPPLLSDADQDVFGRINYWMGIWIYTADALDDCVADYMKKRYNPILAGTGMDPFDAAAFRRDELTRILDDCRQNLHDLILLLRPGEQQELLLRLFRPELSFRAKSLLKTGAAGPQ